MGKTIKEENVQKVGTTKQKPNYVKEHQFPCIHPSHLIGRNNVQCVNYDL
jgi:hypothetical protein